jgi:predicted neuraminidase
VLRQQSTELYRPVLSQLLRISVQKKSTLIHMSYGSHFVYRNFEPCRLASVDKTRYQTPSKNTKLRPALHLHDI